MIDGCPFEAVASTSTSASATFTDGAESECDGRAGAVPLPFNAAAAAAKYRQRTSFSRPVARRCHDTSCAATTCYDRRCHALFFAATIVTLIGLSVALPTPQPPSAPAPTATVAPSSQSKQSDSGSLNIMNRGQASSRANDDDDTVSFRRILAASSSFRDTNDRRVKIGAKHGTKGRRPSEKTTLDLSEFTDDELLQLASTLRRLINATPAGRRTAAAAHYYHHNHQLPTRRLDETVTRRGRRAIADDASVPMYLSSSAAPSSEYTDVSASSMSADHASFARQPIVFVDESNLFPHDNRAFLPQLVMPVVITGENDDNAREHKSEEKSDETKGQVGGHRDHQRDALRHPHHHAHHHHGHERTKNSIWQTSEEYVDFDSDAGFHQSESATKTSSADAAEGLQRRVHELYDLIEKEKSANTNS